MSETIGAAASVLTTFDVMRNRMLDILLLGAAAGIAYMWWRAHTSEDPIALVPNQDVKDIADSIPESVYTYNMPFFGGDRRRVNTPNMPSPTRTPNNPSGQPTFAAVDTQAEMPGPVEYVAEY